MNFDFGNPYPSTRIPVFARNGVKLDFRGNPDGYVVTADDVAAELKRIDHDLRPLEIVVVNTRAGSRYRSPDYVSSWGSDFKVRDCR